MAPLYRTSEESGSTRAKKKLLGKSSWFKGGGGGRTKPGWTRKNKGVKSEHRRKGDTGPLETKTVLFVEHTPEGTLAKRLRDQLGRMEGTMGFRIKVVERAGTRLKDLFSLTNVWGGSQCEREDCTTCTQEGEDLPDCTTRGIVYESICTKCNPGATRPGPLVTANKTVPSVYVGESSRSVYERAGEHWNAYKNRRPDSHIWKHHLVHHEGVGEPEMTVKVVGCFRSALSRQIFEAVRIRRRGADVLNSRGEYNRSRIHRLTIDKGEEHGTLGEHRPEKSEGTNHEIILEGERCLMDRRKKMDRNNTTGTGITTQKGQKRGNNNKLEDGRRSKKRKFAIVGEHWGNKKGSNGLELRIEEAVTIRSTGPLWEPEPVHKGVELRNEVGKSTGGGTEDMLSVSTGPLLSNGPYQFEGNNDVGVEHETKEHIEHAQLGTESAMEPRNMKSVSTKDVVMNNEDSLYDTAATVRMLREDRGTCKVRRGWCVEHEALAKKITSTKKVWTQNKKTGLYRYCSRKMSVWRCDGNMGILLGTMEPRDGAGGTGATGGDGTD